MQNSPVLWQDKLPRPSQDSHKYSRGLALVYAAPAMTGATSLAAQACARIGCGLVNVLVAPERADTYRGLLPPHLVVRDGYNDVDMRASARLYGSGGMGCTIDYSRDIPTVLDADALQTSILGYLNAQYVLTPHQGEWTRLFPDIPFTDRRSASMRAAAESGAIVVFKGAQTCIAHPDGRLAWNDHASPYLASAGTGDVLAGMITGLCAQSMEPFYAACAAVWMHGEAGLQLGAGLVASDIPDYLPHILRDFA